MQPCIPFRTAKLCLALIGVHPRLSAAKMFSRKCSIMGMGLFGKLPFIRVHPQPKLALFAKFTPIRPKIEYN
jgi:hypothetical protein